MSVRALAVFASSFLLFASATAAPHVRRGGGRSWAQRAWLRSIQPRVASGLVARNLARTLGIVPRGRTGAALPSVGPNVIRTASADVPVGTDYLGAENSPSIAASPLDERLVVVVSNDDSTGPNQCTVAVSYDGGASFDLGNRFSLPLLGNPGEYCSSPVVRATPGYSGTPPSVGYSYFVFSYLSVRADSTAADVLTLVTDAMIDPMIIISGPTPVVASALGFPDSPWIGVHTFDAADGVADGDQHVYLTATVFETTGDCAIVWSHSTDAGVTWSAPADLARSTGCNPVLQGARPAGAPGAQVLVCYFDSGSDGLNIDDASAGKFNIACRSSKDRGATWSSLPSSPPILAAKDVPYELPRALQREPGASQPYHDIWRSMFPAVDIDHTGAAQVVFAADPTLSKTDAECGNIFYLKSAYPNGSVVAGTASAWDKWAGRIAVGTGSRAQVFPTIVSQRSNAQVKPIVYLAYADHSRGDPARPNRVYDVKYRKSLVGGSVFLAPVLVTAQSSLSQQLSIGDYFDSAATMRRYWLAWTDRADKTDVEDYESDVFAAWY